MFSPHFPVLPAQPFAFIQVRSPALAAEIAYCRPLRIDTGFVHALATAVHDYNQVTDDYFSHGGPPANEMAAHPQP
jgi:hypothetical protein